jgi:hypothetical protein
MCRPAPEPHDTSLLPNRLTLPDFDQMMLLKDHAVVAIRPIDEELLIAKAGRRPRTTGECRVDGVGLQPGGGEEG